MSITSGSTSVQQDQPVMGPPAPNIYDQLGIAAPQDRKNRGVKKSEPFKVRGENDLYQVLGLKTPSQRFRDNQRKYEEAQKAISRDDVDTFIADLIERGKLDYRDWIKPEWYNENGSIDTDKVKRAMARAHAFGDPVWGREDASALENRAALAAQRNDKDYSEVANYRPWGDPNRYVVKGGGPRWKMHESMRSAAEQSLAKIVGTTLRFAAVKDITDPYSEQLVPDNWTATITSGVTQGAVIGPLLAGGAIMGGARGTAAVMTMFSALFGLEEFQDTYDETENMALAVGVGALTGLVELASFGIQSKVAKNVVEDLGKEIVAGNMKSAARISRGLGTESSVEGLEELVQLYGTEAMYAVAGEKTWNDAFSTMVKQSPKSFVGGAAGGAVGSGPALIGAELDAVYARSPEGKKANAGREWDQYTQAVTESPQMRRAIREEADAASMDLLNPRFVGQRQLSELEAEAELSEQGEYGRKMQRQRDILAQRMQFERDGKVQAEDVVEFVEANPEAAATLAASGKTTRAAFDDAGVPKRFNQSERQKFMEGLREYAAITQEQEIEAPPFEPGSTGPIIAEKTEVGEQFIRPLNTGEIRQRSGKKRDAAIEELKAQAPDGLTVAYLENGYRGAGLYYVRDGSETAAAPTEQARKRQSKAEGERKRKNRNIALEYLGGEREFVSEEIKQAAEAIVEESKAVAEGAWDASVAAPGTGEFSSFEAMDAFVNSAKRKGASAEDAQRLAETLKSGVTGKQFTDAVSPWLGSDYTSDAQISILQSLSIAAARGDQNAIDAIDRLVSEMSGGSTSTQPAPGKQKLKELEEQIRKGKAPTLVNDGTGYKTDNPNFIEFRDAAGNSNKVMIDSVAKAYGVENLSDAPQNEPADVELGGKRFRVMVGRDDANRPIITDIMVYGSETAAAPTEQQASDQRMRRQLENSEVVLRQIADEGGDPIKTMIELWRKRERGQRFDHPDAARAAKEAQDELDRMASEGYEVSGKIGDDFVIGQIEHEVVAWEEAPTSRTAEYSKDSRADKPARIKQVMRPAVKKDGQIVKKGEVVLEDRPPTLREVDANERLKSLMRSKLSGENVSDEALSAARKEVADALAEGWRLSDEASAVTPADANTGDTQADSTATDEQQANEELADEAVRVWANYAKDEFENVPSKIMTVLMDRIRAVLVDNPQLAKSMIALDGRLSVSMGNELLAAEMLDYILNPAFDQGASIEMELDDGVSVVAGSNENIMGFASQIRYKGIAKELSQDQVDDARSDEDLAFALYSDIVSMMSRVDEVIAETEKQDDDAPTIADTIRGEQQQAAEEGAVNDAGPEDDIDYGTPTNPNLDALAGEYARRLGEGESLGTIVQARKIANDLVGGTIPREKLKVVDEAIEVAVGRVARDIVKDNRLSEGEKFDALVDLLERQPNLSTRTSTSITQQAYSTPIPLAYAASQIADVADARSVLETSAGNGHLLIEAEPPQATLFELNPQRAQNLRNMGYAVTEGDSMELDYGRKYDTIISNPPFGKTHKNGAVRQFVVGNLETDQIDYAMVFKALQHLEQGGRAVFIIGSQPGDLAKRREQYSKQRAQQFFYRLYNEFNVLDHFTVDGALYRKQGAGFPVDVLVVEHGKTTDRKLPASQPPYVLTTWEQVKEKMNDNPRQRNRGLTGGSPSGGSGGGGGGGGSAGGTGVSGGSGGSNTGTSGQGDGAGTVTRPPTGEAGGTTADADADGTGVGDGVVGPGVSQQGDGRPDVADGDTEQVDDQTGERPDSGAGVDSDLNVEDILDQWGTNPESLDAATKDGTDLLSADRDTELVATGENEFQVAYKPGSRLKSVDTLVPTRLQIAITKALERIQEITGKDIDTFVADELGMPVQEMMGRFSAEQADALAMAIFNVKQGKGFIIGDQTGVGKGRVVSGMLLYAERQNMIPVFVTDKPNLYADIIRDLSDIGANRPDAPYELFPTNNGLEGKSAIDLPDGRQIRSVIGGVQVLEEAYDNYLKTGRFEAEYQYQKDTAPAKKRRIRAVATTYDQLTGAASTPRRDVMRKIMPNAMLVMDESHKAGAATPDNARRSRNAPPRLGDMMRELVELSKATFYSSATFAKRPELMTLYSKTDLGMIENLEQTVKMGGVPMQQIVSEMLAEAGQYIRRERSFDGVTMDAEVLPIDVETGDFIAQTFWQIDKYDQLIRDLIKPERQDSDTPNTPLQDWIIEQGGSLLNDPSVSRGGITNTAFTSVLHNAVSQMLLGFKAQAIIDSLVANHKAGKKGVVAVSNTMQSLIEQVMEAEGAKFGDKASVEFSATLERYLERVQEVTVSAPNPNGRGNITVRIRIPDELIPPGLIQIREKIRERIHAGIYEGLAASPLDYITSELRKRGIRVGELTGRSVYIDMDGDEPVYASRGSNERNAAAKTRTVSDFNAGEIDVVILNSSAATGISMHASEKFKDQSPRQMFIVQPDPNIDVFMQIMGRIHRTGQVEYPGFTLVLADDPNENRYASVLMKKMGSLNANVTADSKGSVGFDVPDVMNWVGDQVMYDLLQLDPTIEERVGLRGQYSAPDPSNIESEGELIRLVTGRLPMLSRAEREQIWAQITDYYNTTLEDMDSRGEHPFRAKVYDVDAVVLGSAEAVSAKDMGSPFGKPVIAEQVDMKSLANIPTGDKVLERVLSENNAESIEEARQKHQKAIDVAQQRFEQVYTETAAKAAEAARSMRSVAQGAKRMLESMPPGSVVLAEFSDSNNNIRKKNGVLIGWRQTPSRNPLAPSSWTPRIWFPDEDIQLRRPLSQLMEQERDRAGGIETVQVRAARGVQLEKILAEFDKAASELRSNRIILTGNIPAAMSMFQAGSKPRIARIGMRSGEVKSAIIMPRDFKMGDLKPTIKFSNAENVIRMLQARANSVQFIGQEKSDDLTIIIEGSQVRMLVKRTKRIGMRFYAHPEIVARFGDFTSTGSRMTKTFSIDDFAQALDIWMRDKKSPIDFTPNTEYYDIAAVIEGVRTTSEMQNDLDKDVTDQAERDADDREAGGGTDIGSFLLGGALLLGGMMIPGGDAAMAAAIPASKKQGRKRPSNFNKSDYTQFDDWLHSDVENEQVQRFRNKDGVGKPKFRVTAAAGLENVLHAVSRRNIHLANNTENAVANEAIRLQDNAHFYAADKVRRRLETIVDQLDANGYLAFKRVVLLENLLAGAKRGELRSYGYRDVAHVQRDLKSIASKAAQSPEVLQALRVRRAYVRQLSRELVANNLLPEYATDRADSYFHQQVAFYEKTNRRKGGSGRLDEQKAAFQRRRVEEDASRDPEKDPNTDFLQSEAAWMIDAEAALMRKKNLEMIEREYDVYHDLTAQAKKTNEINTYGGKAKYDLVMKRYAERDMARDAGEDKTVAKLNAWLSKNDPFWSYKQKMGMAFSRLADAVRQGANTGTFNGFKLLNSTAAALNDNDANLWKMVRYLARQDDAIANSTDKAAIIAARTMLRAIADRNAMMKEKLGNALVEWRDFIPEGYSEWNPKPGNVYFSMYGIQENLINDMMQRMGRSLSDKDLADLQLPISAGDLRKVLVLGPPRRPMVLPSQVADQLDTLQHKKLQGAIGRGVDRAMAEWKAWILLNPFGMVSYSARNITGDLDPIVASNPQILKYVGQSEKMLRQFYSGKTKKPPEILEKAMQNAVIGSSRQSQELANPNEMQIFKRLYKRRDDEQDSTAVDLAKKAGKAPKFVYQEWMRRAGTVNEYRENIARLAAFMFYYEQLQNRGKPTNYGGSKRSVVDALIEAEGVEVAAAHLARNLIGDYGNITVAGNWLRHKLIPFWSFQEINIKRTPRLMANNWRSFAAEGDAGGLVRMAKVPLQAAASLGVFWQYAFWRAFNWLFFDEEEDELTEDERRNPHIILGRLATGDLLVFRNVTATGDFLEWFGMNDALSSVDELIEGSMNFKELGGMMFSAWANKLAQGMGPQVQVPLNTIGGVSVYPDVFALRPTVRDEAFAAAIGLRDPYLMVKGLVTDTGDRARPNWLLRRLPGVTDPYRNALGRMHALRDRWLRRQGYRVQSGFHRSRVYQMRNAAAADDMQAFMEARAYFIKNTGEKIDPYESFVSSVKMTDPIDPRMSDERQAAFEDWLVGNDIEVYHRSRAYAKWLEERMIAMWHEAKKSDDPETIERLAASYRNETVNFAKTLASDPPESLFDRDAYYDRVAEAMRGLSVRGVPKQDILNWYTDFANRAYRTTSTRRRRISNVRRALRNYEALGLDDLLDRRGFHEEFTESNR